MKTFKKILKNSVALSMFLAFMLPVASFAQIQYELVGDANTGSDLNTNMVTDTTVDSSLNTSINTGITTDVQSDVNLDTESKTESENNDYAKSGMTLQLNADGVAVTNASQVQTEADLDIFAKNMSKLSTNRSVSSVDIESENDGDVDVQVAYKHKAKLFGFIPVYVKSYNSAKVDNQGALAFDSKLSWWNFLVTDVHHDKAEIESRIKNNANIQANVQTELSANTKAEIVERIVAELDAYAQANAQAEATM
ncbi:MAG: hypothetical protein K9M36_00150 [Candidatus Pacebacteria bacterium]|nr:hypothetical protein [Candidatus Paceibacterota bacterium]